MTQHDGFDRTVATWLDGEAGQGSPDYLDDVLVRTARIRQRPAWSSLERWLPMQATARFAPAVPRVGGLVVVVALVLALIAVALFAGVGRTPLPAPFGPARNGDFAFSADGDIFRFDPVAGTRTALVTGAPWDFGTTFSRDGTRFAFGRLSGDPSQVPDTELGMIVAVADPDGGRVRELTPYVYGNCWSDWSPNGHDLVFRTERPDHYGLLNVLNVDAGTVRTIDPGVSVRCSALGYRAPGGAEIVFRGDTATSHAIYAIHPDGTGLRVLNTEHPVCDCDTGVLSSDGRLLAVDRWDDGVAVRLWLLDLDSGTERRVALPDDHFARGGVFSPDSSLIAFPMLHRIGPRQNAYTVAVAPVDGSSPVRTLGPEIELPATDTDEAFASISFAPDGSALIVGYPDDPSSTTNSLWLLPLDGSIGRIVGSGTFASLEIQRRAP
jgi:dipeptidyl aminopeptidase/acylaminoacyl peptidase